MQKKQKIDYVDYYPYGQFPYNYTKNAHEMEMTSKIDVSTMSEPTPYIEPKNNNMDISKLIPLMLSMQDKSIEPNDIINAMAPMLSNNNKQVTELLKYMTKTKKPKKSSPKPLSFETNIIDIDSLERIN